MTRNSEVNPAAHPRQAFPSFMIVQLHPHDRLRLLQASQSHTTEFKGKGGKGGRGAPLMHPSLPVTGKPFPQSPSAELLLHLFSLNRITQLILNQVKRYSVRIID